MPDGSYMNKKVPMKGQETKKPSRAKVVAHQTTAENFLPSPYSDDYSAEFYRFNRTKYLNPFHDSVSTDKKVALQVFNFQTIQEKQQNQELAIRKNSYNYKIRSKVIKNSTNGKLKQSWISTRPSDGA